MVSGTSLLIIISSETLVTSMGSSRVTLKSRFRFTTTQSPRAIKKAMPKAVAFSFFSKEGESVSLVFSSSFPVKNRLTRSDMNDRNSMSCKYIHYSIMCVQQFLSQLSNQLHRLAFLQWNNDLHEVRGARLHSLP